MLHEGQGVHESVVSFLSGMSFLSQGVHESDRESSLSVLLLLLDLKPHATRPTQRPMFPLRARRPRVAASPSIQVSDLVDIFRAWCQTRGTRDITTLLSGVSSKLTWKGAPKAGVLAGVSDLCLELAKLAPNGALPGQKTSDALQHLHGEQAVNFTGKDTKTWADDHSAYVRLAMSKFRCLLDETQFARTMSKAIQLKLAT